jgi:hypothetical protein
MSCTAYGHAKGWWVSGVIFAFRFPSLGESDTLPDHNVFLRFSFRLFDLLFDCWSFEAFHSWFFSFSLPPSFSLSLSNATPRNEYDERDEKDDANTQPSWNI